MHLKQLKLAGFKSFVDPTVVPFPSQLVAVVGPNGCGKSNIIDAVRWVMGESSAKTLRGESMTDVIFNGSSHRKAVGQASIELIFDNSLGRLTGQYTSYQEIAVKRVVTRDGESSYYLNGSRCRRRDITDIFLGTGVGTRGYSIIGQGTISRLIEARPEELRAYLEEAAGVSKYKERRRETMLRIEHTRENLARVADIRDELDKQLQRLERQAKAAERYKILKAEERLCKAKILALKWQTLTNEQQTKQRELHQLSIEYEQYQAKATDAYKQSTLIREKLHETNALFQQTQTTFYQLATEIARLEESIQQHQREKIRLKNEQQQLQEDWQQAENQLQQDKEALQVSQLLTVQLQENLQVQQESFDGKQRALEDEQKQYHDWTVKIQQKQADLNKAQREEQLERARLQHLNQQKQQIQLRLEKINAELQLIDVDGLGKAFGAQQALRFNLQESLQQEEKKYQHLLTGVTQLRQQLEKTEKQLYQTQDKVRHFTIKHASLLAAQQTALGKDIKTTRLTQWLDKPRLVEVIQVEKTWQSACEMVLADGLQGVVLDSLDELWPQISELQTNAALFLTESHPAHGKKNDPRLSDKITGIQPNWIHPLDKIYTASSLDEALACVTNLDTDESVITADGYWLGRGWIKIAGKETQDEASLLCRQDELISLQETLTATQNELKILQEMRDISYTQLKENELQLESAKQSLSTSHNALHACEAEINHQERTLQQGQRRKKDLIEEKEALEYNLEELASQQDEATGLLATATRVFRQYEEEQHQLTQEKDRWSEVLLLAQQSLNEARTLCHHSQLQVEREHLKIQQINDHINREQLRLNTLNSRQSHVADRLRELEVPDATLHSVLNEKIMQHNELDVALSLQREQSSSLTHELEALESLIRTEEKQARVTQEKIQQVQMQEQALSVRAGSILEALDELEADVETLLSTLSSDINEDLRQRHLDDIVIKINKLGAINLVAIEEYNNEFQRRQHLDNQHQDLTEAVVMLETAIEKMDKETRQRLRSTFEEVNTAFQALFPRLFGGGRALLELTGDNLLDAGIVVLAQPPGKRNSTIHLLSGGEKAMTAVALVFAIFQLNPSPFCMLDEVDAPLDDVNVSRFCDLVKEMSQSVQFLFITHNKITMELADHLIGVTMREPGVSRIVAVDVEEALSMSEPG
ncbi:chromosome segregation protein SMC [Legionella fairfieldensis]|uniref:chromosome segregation protein SMC n=1 Tax=Legionella fairfieldensis TaxID=45064 RepID=UPI00048AF732|nr:chromosome segregation protein SMC [Legionella fairfieldensis]